MNTVSGEQVKNQGQLLLCISFIIIVITINICMALYITRNLYTHINCFYTVGLASTSYSTTTSSFSALL